MRNTAGIPPSSLQTTDGPSKETEDSQELMVPAVTAPVGSERLANERAGQFMKLLPRVLNSENAKAVHDLRVCGRRLQQVLVAIFPTEKESSARKVIRAIRKARRGLSGWRDCDVAMALLDKRLRRLRNPDEQQALAGRERLPRQEAREGNKPRSAPARHAFDLLHAYISCALDNQRRWKLA
jgi:CHAD domain-containing protein